MSEVKFTQVYAETPLEAYRRGYEAGYMYGRIDEMKRKPYDSRTPGQRFKSPEVPADPAQRIPQVET